jgi:Tol biopolymer transport system component
VSSPPRATACLALVIAAALCAPTGYGASRRSAQVAFQSDRDGDGDLWIVDVAGGDARRLTDNSTPDASPAWSPDGKTIVYACAPDDNWEICTLDVATLRVRQLTRTAASEFDPAYTGDGRRIALETYEADSPTGKADIATMSTRGGVPTPLMTTPDVDEQDPAPSPDPDSTRLVYASDANIVLSDTADPKSVTYLTKDGGATGRSSDPAFAGPSIVVFSQRKRGPGINIVQRDLRVKPAGGPRTKAVTNSARIDLRPAASPAAAGLFFARSSSTARGFRIVRLVDGSSRVRAVTDGPGRYDDTEPAPRPIPGGSPLGLRAPEAQATGCQTILGGSGSDVKAGTGGSDCMYGRGGNDTLSGRAGADKLWGDEGRDVLRGEDGNDDFHATDKERDDINGGDGGADEAWIDDGLDTYTKVEVRH